MMQEPDCWKGILVALLLGCLAFLLVLAVTGPTPNEQANAHDKYQTRQKSTQIQWR